jgi:SAM-dependent methyltransferase
VASEFDAYADSYRDAVQRSIEFCGQEHEVFTRRKARHLVDVAERHLGAPVRLRALDVGCGVGLTDRYLVGSLGELHGVDTAPDAATRAAALNPSVDYHVQRGERLPFEDSSFDLAFAICVVHHVPPHERRAFTAEVRRVLRRGGLAVVFEHNPLNPLTRLAVSRCAFDEDAVLLRQRTVSRLLADAGLSAVERRYVIFFPFERRRTRAIERKLSWLPAAAQYYVAARR